MATFVAVERIVTGNKEVRVYLMRCMYFDLDVPQHPSITQHLSIPLIRLDFFVSVGCKILFQISSKEWKKF